MGIFALLIVLIALYSVVFHVVSQWIMSSLSYNVAQILIWVSTNIFNKELFRLEEKKL